MTDIPINRSTMNFIAFPFITNLLLKQFYLNAALSYDTIKRNATGQTI